MHIRTFRRHFALILCIAIGGPARSASAQALPVAHPAVQAVDSLLNADSTTNDETNDEAASKSDTRIHGRKVIRPGRAIKPIFVWRNSAVFATLLAIGGALLLSLPVAAVYEFTSRKRTTLDRGLTQSILLLPPIVAGIVMVVQGSLALAFSLAGVASSVRFRSQLKDTDDAVYVFLALSIGIAAGAQALDIAVVVSVGSSIAALVVWWITGRIHHAPVVLTPASGEASPGAVAAPSNSATDVASGEVAAGPLGHDDGRDATVIVWTPHDDHARDAVESLLDGLTKQWRLEVIDEEPNGDARLRYSVRSKKRLDPDALVGAITAAGAAHGIRAELGRPDADKPAGDDKDDKDKDDKDEDDKDKDDKDKDDKKDAKAGAAAVDHAGEPAGAGPAKKASKKAAKTTDADAEGDDTPSGETPAPVT